MLFQLRKVPPPGGPRDQYRWRFAQAVELTAWARILKHRVLTRLGAQHGQELLIDIAKLRHIAVHRAETSTAAIVRYLNAAVTLADVVVHDDRAASQLTELQNEIAKAAEALDQRNAAQKEHL
jgi:hypothetical protein